MLHAGAVRPTVLACRLSLLAMKDSRARVPPTTNVELHSTLSLPTVGSVQYLQTEPCVGEYVGAEGLKV